MSEWNKYVSNDRVSKNNVFFKSSTRWEIRGWRYSKLCKLNGYVNITLSDDFEIHGGTDLENTDRYTNTLQNKHTRSPQQSLNWHDICDSYCIIDLDRDCDFLLSRHALARWMFLSEVIPRVIHQSSISQTSFQSSRRLLEHILLLSLDQHKQINSSTVQSMVAIETRLQRPSDYNKFLTQWTACLVLVRIIRIGQWQHNRHCVFTIIYKSTQSHIHTHNTQNHANCQRT